MGEGGERVAKYAKISMKIGIDARMLGSQQGGIGRYIHELIKAFKHESTDAEFVLFLRKENWDLVAETPKVKKVLVDIHWYGWREQLLLPGIIKKEKVDLMHFPHWNIPFFYHRPFIVTIHDLLLLHYPTRSASTLGPMSYFFKNLAYKIILRHAINNSRHILAPSEYTKNDIMKNFKVKAEKITVTHLAPMPMADAGTTASSAARPTPFNDIKKPYALYVGVAYPHKNLDGMIKAWKIFCEKHGHNYQLVLAGRKNYFYDRLASRFHGDDSIVFTGYIPDEDLPALYQGASLYVFPSFYEGFGLPPLEAMQYGVPVASSNATCMPEILNEAAVYFDPHNPDDIADTIWRVLNDENLRQTLNKNSVQLIHNYSWEKTARATLEVYSNVL